MSRNTEKIIKKMMDAVKDEKIKAKDLQEMRAIESKIKNTNKKIKPSWNVAAGMTHGSYVDSFVEGRMGTAMHDVTELANEYEYFAKKEQKQKNSDKEAIAVQFELSKLYRQLGAKMYKIMRDTHPLGS